MHIAPERTEFDPPPQRGNGRAMGLAVLAHLVLIGAVTWGVNWREDPTRLAAEAELWSPTVQQAAPRAVEPPPPPPPPPAPPPPRAQPAPPPPAPKEADIAIQREKDRQLRDKQRQQEEAERDRQRKLEVEKAEARKKELAEKQRQEDQKKRELAEKQKVQKLAQEKREREERDAERLAKQRDENLRRIQGMAGATGGPQATGNAERSSGPSDSYGGRIRARVRPNIVFTDDVPGNPTTLVEVRMAPDGTITARRILRSSGIKSWDDAVLRALDRTEILPRDVDGRVHSPLHMEFRPKD